MESNITSYTHTTKSHVSSDEEIGSIWNLFSDNPLPTALFLKFSGKLIKKNKAFRAYPSHDNNTDFMSWLRGLADKKKSRSALEELEKSIQEYRDCKECSVVLNIPGKGKTTHLINVHAVKLGTKESGFMLAQIIQKQEH